MSGIIAAGAVIGAVAGGGSSLWQKSKYNRSLTKAFKKQMYYAQMNYNWNQNQLTRQEQSAYDSAVSNLFQLSYNALQNNATVEASLAETGYEGRTAGQIKRSISGAVLRQKTALKDAYETDVTNIRSQKDALYVQMKNSVEQARDQLKSQYKGGISYLMEFLDTSAKGAAIGAFTAGAGSALAGAAGGAAGGTGGSIAGTVGGETVLAGTSSVGGSAGLSGASALGTSTTGVTTSASTAGTGGSFMSNFMANYSTMRTNNAGMFNFLDYLQNATGALNQGFNGGRRGSYGGYYY
nr:MAG TPA: putative internal virion protein B [Caudoviricetes sp.]